MSIRQEHTNGQQLNEIITSSYVEAHLSRRKVPNGNMFYFRVHRETAYKALCKQAVCKHYCFFFTKTARLESRIEKCRLWFCNKWEPLIANLCCWGMGSSRLPVSSIWNPALFFQCCLSEWSFEHTRMKTHTCGRARTHTCTHAHTHTHKRKTVLGAQEMVIRLVLLYTVCVPTGRSHVLLVRHLETKI